MNAQKESLFMQAPANPQKVCDENESRNKEKMMSAETIFGRRKEFTKACAENSCNRYQTTSCQRFLIQ